MDLAAANSNTGNVSVLLGDGTETLPPPPTSPSALIPFQ
ncbi:MAG: hypothetical protein V7K19_05715 [Nostoc sp.]